jgi:hypothetical protein
MVVTYDERHHGFRRINTRALVLASQTEIRHDGRFADHLRRAMATRATRAYGGCSSNELAAAIAAVDALCAFLQGGEPLYGQQLAKPLVAFNMALAALSKGTDCSDASDTV